MNVARSVTSSSLTTQTQQVILYIFFLSLVQTIYLSDTYNCMWCHMWESTSFPFNNGSTALIRSAYLSLHLPSVRPTDCSPDGRKTNSLTADLALLQQLWNGPVIRSWIGFLTTLDIREGSDKTTPSFYGLTQMRKRPPLGLWTWWKGLMRNVSDDWPSVHLKAFVVLLAGMFFLELFLTGESWTTTQSESKVKRWEVFNRAISQIWTASAVNAS